MLVRADLYHQLGGLDDGFFAHMEEIDLCWRAYSHGFHSIYEPASSVYHIGGGTLPKNSPRKTYLNFRNNLLLLYKNLPAGNFLGVVPYLSVPGPGHFKMTNEFASIGLGFGTALGYAKARPDIATVLVIAWFLFQVILQQSLFEWIGDRIDNLTNDDEPGIGPIPSWV